MVKDPQKWDQMVQITSALGLVKIVGGLALWSALSDLQDACPGQVTVTSYYPPICILLGCVWIGRGQKVKKMQQASGGLLPTTYAAAPEGTVPVQVVTAQAVDAK
jgi:hypothetical protein